VTFAEKLHTLRKSAGLSEAALAEASGVPFGSVHGYGMGRRKAPFQVVVRLAKALNVDIAEFSECDFGEWDKR
jgi:transcriptional regulator with XRE-family HTH domain